MSTSGTFKISLENLADGARAPEPGRGRRAAVESDGPGLRTVIEAFAALPALEAEDAGARILVSISDRRIVVRSAGGRLIVEEGGSFAGATVDEIMERLSSAAPASAAGASAGTSASARGSSGMSAEAGSEPLPASSGSGRGRIWVFAALLVLFPVIWWASTRPATPDGVEWEGTQDARQAILGAAAAHYASSDEQLMVDAPASRLVVSDKLGNETLATSLRVGRRAGIPVLVTEAGVVLEVGSDGSLRLNGETYQRVPSPR